MIPDYQTLMMPLVRYVSNKQEHKFRDVIEGLSARFKLSDSEREELLPSGQQAVFDNRVGQDELISNRCSLGRELK